MSLIAEIKPHEGRPVLHVNGTPTTELWCYGDPPALPDFLAGGVRICQFEAPRPSWWRGKGEYDFAPLDAKIDAFLAITRDVLLIPRVTFGYEGEGWWADAHPDELSVGRDVDGNDVDYKAVRVRPVDCWQSSGSEVWTQDAAQAMADFVRHCEEKYGENLLGYQVGAGISTEWFRWWTFTEGVYEDYSPAGAAAFRRFLTARYGSDAELQKAWGRPEVTLATAAVPEPRRLHTPMLDFFRHPTQERDIIDWLACVSDGNVTQMLALAAAAKEAAGGKKLAGVFFGYFWPHWNTQTPARMGHLGLERVLASPAIDYVSAPYHYDNRMTGGYHHSETVSQVIERAGKLFVDEIDTATHLANPQQWPYEVQGKPRSVAESCALLRRDAAAVLGTAGTAWWMDLRYDRWFNDPDIQATLAQMQGLSAQTLAWGGESRAEVALVIDDVSTLYCDLTSNLSQYFTSLGRQFDWSDLGFPMDTVALRELPRARQYKLYVFLNCWHVSTELRREIHARTRRSGGYAIWFHAAGYYDENRYGEEAIRDLTGIEVYADRAEHIPAVRVRDTGHPFVEQSLTIPRGATEFGGMLSAERQKRLVRENSRGWDEPFAPLFVVDDPAVTVLGHYVHDGSPGLAVLETLGWCSVWCGAPLLPGWLLKRVASSAGVHFYTEMPTQVWHRGTLLAVYLPRGDAELTVWAPSGQELSLLMPKGSEQRWRPDTSVPQAPQLSLRWKAGEVKFFRTSG